METNVFLSKILNEYLKITCITASIFSTTVAAFPAQVLIIRHAEKPLQGPELSVKGFERAAALPFYFLNTPELLKFGSPTVVYAQKPSEQDKSKRSIQTCKPTADALHLKINTTYTKDQYPQMISDILKDPHSNNKTVLICWEHRVIPEMAHLLGVNPKPKKWHDKVFDRTFVITINHDGTINQFNNLAQTLMYGDSDS